MKTLLLIDANSFIHRAYHALPPLKSPEGVPTGALYGLTNILLKRLEEKHPDWAVACFDRPEPTFREKKFKEYKAQRPPAPDELISQIIEARSLMKILGIPVVELAGYEADDLIGTLAERLKKDAKVLIVTGDLDALQLVEENVAVEVPRKGLSDIVLYDAKAEKERFGVPPKSLPDYKGRTGDQSDNIPGVPGIGPKTAELLLKEFGTLESVYEKMPENHKFAKKILPHKKQALLSKELAIINTDAPIKETLEDIRYQNPDMGALIAYLENLGFESIVKRLGGEQNNTRHSLPKSDFQRKSDFKPAETVIFVTNTEKPSSAILSSKKLKVAYDWKSMLKENEIKEVAQPIFDVKIAAWLLGPDGRDFSLETILKKYETSNLRDLFVILERGIKKEGLEFVFREIEMPVIPVLAKMEQNGIKVNAEKMRALQKEARKELEDAQKEIYREAGMEFNINSPKQMSEILFDKLGIKDKGRKTAGGQRSTREEVLEEMRDAHPVIPLILEYRQTFKINSTYLEPLIHMAEEERDGRVRTTYLQTGTATGRISSEKPNLQNIPQESKWAAPLRKCFEAEPGRSFLSADYSQLELRLLAHASRDEALTGALHEGKDIHNLTATKEFSVREDEVDKERRRAAKTLNFGIVYGMGPRSFARATGFGVKEASEFIASYFKNFPGIKIWQEKVLEKVREKGFVENEHGRKRWFENAGSEHPRYRAEVERMATNMPLQSLGADIIKLAMIKTAKEVGTDLLLTIHDELLFELPDDILEETKKKIKKEMEEVVTLRVPLKVDVKTGKSWGNMKE